MTEGRVPYTRTEEPLGHWSDWDGEWLEVVGELHFYRLTNRSDKACDIAFLMRGQYDTGEPTDPVFRVQGPARLNAWPGIEKALEEVRAARDSGFYNDAESAHLGKLGVGVPNDGVYRMEDLYKELLVGRIKQAGLDLNGFFDANDMLTEWGVVIDGYVRLRKEGDGIGTPEAVPAPVNDEGEMLLQFIGSYPEDDLFYTDSEKRLERQQPVMDGM